MSCGMKALNVRNLGIKVTHMQWNNKIDLLALATEKSEVIIQRLNLQKLFTFPPPPSLDDPHKNMEITCISWHVSEPLLTVGYDSGTIFVLDVEKQAPQQCCCVKQKPIAIRCTQIEDISLEEYRPRYEKVEIPFENFLPSFDKLYTVDQGRQSIQGIDSYQCLSDSLNPMFLVVSCEESISLITLGGLRSGTIDLKEHVSQPFEVLDARLTPLNNNLLVLVREGETYKALVFDNEMLRDHLTPLITIAKKQRLIEVTLKFLSNIVDTVIEAFERVSIEVDNKLAASNLNIDKMYGTLSADLLEFLLFGIYTPELNKFLVTDMTQKGIKKLSQSTEMGYRCIQNIVGNPVQQTTINLFYLLNTLRGPKLNHYFFGDLLVPTAIDNALSKCVTMIMKAIELQLVVDNCAMDMKVFWAWLSVALISITDENIAEDGNQMSQEGRMNLAEILNNIEDYFSLKDNDNGRSKFNMEKIGQYLKNEYLKEAYVSELTESNSWLKWLEENKCLENCPKIYQPSNKQSLIQILAELTETSLSIFKNAEIVLSNNFVLRKSLTLGSGLRSDLHLSSYASSNMFSLALSKKEFIVVKMLDQLDSCKFALVSLKTPVFGSYKHSDLNLIDIKIYNEDILSVCLSLEEEKKPQTYFVQFPLESLKHKWIPREIDGSIDLSAITENDVATAFFLELVDFDAATRVENESIAIEVSGSRKVAAILSDNFKKMKIYEMEVDNDEFDSKNTSM